MVTVLGAWWGQKPYCGFTQKQERNWVTSADNSNSFTRWKWSKEMEQQGKTQVGFEMGEITAAR